MKKIFYIYFFLIFLTFSTSSHAKDITDYEINGVSIGQSLLNYLSKDEILAEIEINKPTYNYLNSDYGEVYLTLSSDEYDFMSVFVKPNDKNFIIHYVSGSIKFPNNKEECYKKQKEIELDLSKLFKNVKKSNHEATFPWDPTGESKSKYVQLIFESGNAITISCSNFSIKAKSERGMEDGLSIELSLKEVEDWFVNY